MSDINPSEKSISEFLTTFCQGLNDFENAIVRPHNVNVPHYKPHTCPGCSDECGLTVIEEYRAKEVNRILNKYFFFDTQRDIKQKESGMSLQDLSKLRLLNQADFAILTYRVRISCL